MLRRSSTRRIKWLACLAASLVLITQIAMAAEGCMLRPGTAGLQPAAVEQAGCDGMAMDETLSLACCVAGEQAAATVDQQLHFVPPSHSTGRGHFPLPEVHAAAARDAASDVPRGPPLRILFCSYQT
jgi:hypothetical protein